MKNFTNPNNRGFGETSNKQPLPYERNLKVRESFYDHHFTNQRPGYPIPVPWINMKGYWLDEAGFTINTPLVVKIRKGKIVLTVKS